MIGQPAVAIWVSPSAVGETFAVAVAALPERTVAASGPNGAVAVVGGVQWWTAARRALDEGAIGLILTNLSVIATDDLGELAAVPVPVVIDRALLRADLVDQAVAARAGSPARLVNVDVSASARAMPEALRDAVGWAREVCGPLRVAAGSWTGRNGVVLLETRDAGCPVALTLSAMRPEGRWPVLHVSVLGETRTEVLLDPAAARARVSTTTAEGELAAPALREARQRHAVRRLLDALAGGEAPRDVEGIVHDITIVDELVRAREHIDVADFANRQMHLP